jgi:short-subunit dehydrogenase
MARTLAGRRILITGASSGIGRCLAEQAARAGARVALVARSADKLATLQQGTARSGGEGLALPADLTVREDRERLLEGIVSAWGGLDVLVNNAGVGSFGHFIDSSEAVLRQVMEVNFFAPAELIRLALPVLKHGDQPAIVNIASMCGRRALPAWPEYSASKFALCGLTEALRAEFVRFEVDVLLILPGLTRTDLDSHLLRNTGRMKIDFSAGMPPKRVAERILRALEKNRSETVLGREARLMLLLNRALPRLVDRLMARKVRQLYATEMSPAAGQA